jgi:hypothetical protein
MIRVIWAGTTGGAGAVDAVGAVDATDETSRPKSGGKERETGGGEDETPVWITDGDREHGPRGTGSTKVPDIRMSPA